MNKIKKFILKYKGYIICICIVIVSIISIVIQDNERKEEIKVNEQKINNEEGKIGVYITGAVKNPGVYYLEDGSRIYNLLDICGGINDNADIDKLNLAQKLNDSDKIDVPIRKEISDEVVFEKTEENDNELVNINKASSEELQTLNGIGEATAKKIIDYRKDNKFESIEDIMNVPGIGESKFDNIKEYICVK